MMDYLIDLGHEDILYVSQEKDLDEIIESEKISKYEETMKSIGKKPIVHKINTHRIEGTYAIGEELLKTIKDNNISAVFCCQDELAIGLMNYLNDVGIKVPDEISVAGYGDINVASIYRPSLTTIKEPYYDIGAVSLRKILKSIKEKDSINDDIKLPVRLLKRQSCKELK